MKKLLISPLGLAAATGAVAGGSVYDFSADLIYGRTQNLSEYKGKVLLVVNVASSCGFTKQYNGLQKLYETYKDQGLVVLGFPANDFLSQEPGTNEEIAEFSSIRFAVEFPMFGKISVRGENQHPLYAWLTKQSGKKVSWNFNKFLVGRDGQFIEQFGSRIEPQDEKLARAIEGALQN